MLLTMPNMKWLVYVGPWVWVYEFSRFGTVTWTDPRNNLGGRGRWSLDKRSLITRWVGSKTWEAWDVPINPFAATGKCHMAHQTLDLLAESISFYLDLGDVLYFSASQQTDLKGVHAAIVYPKAVKAGGSIAWICNNPGNIRIGDDFGAYKGKTLDVKTTDPKTQEVRITHYAIFPDAKTGADAIPLFLKKNYVGKTVRAAMHDYAPAGDGHNDPDKYAEKVAKGMNVSPDSKLTKDSDFARMAQLITHTEGTKEGTTWARDDPDLPQEIRERLIDNPHPPTAEELRAVLPSRAYFLTRD